MASRAELLSLVRDYANAKVTAQAVDDATRARQWIADRKSEMDAHHFKRVMDLTTETDRVRGRMMRWRQKRHIDQINAAYDRESYLAAGGDEIAGIRADSLERERSMARGVEQDMLEAELLEKELIQATDAEVANHRAQSEAFVTEFQRLGEIIKAGQDYAVERKWQDLVNAINEVV